MTIDATLQQAAQAIRKADVLLLAAGAGMGVDSGLPDFRGKEGFWRAYPPFATQGLAFSDLARPEWFARDPELAWGFYGHRLNLYRATQPHAGFDRLLRWAGEKPGGAFVFTSNVDGQFQKAGFREEEIWECHGSIHYLQCSRPCTEAVWSAEALQVEIDPATFRAVSTLPTCPQCGAVARPNILLFGDSMYLSHRSERQQEGLIQWINGEQADSLAIIECGAGTAIPTVRLTTENLMRQVGCPLIRINVHESEGPLGALSLPMGAAEALGRIDELL